MPLPSFDHRPDIRLIAADLDGTLLDDEKELHEHFWPLVDALVERGVLFCPASGRQYANLYERFRPLAHEMVFIAENGAFVVRGTEEISSDTLSPGLVRSVVNVVRDVAAVVVSGVHWLDVMNPSTSKGAGLRHIQEALGITPGQTMVFGDFLNDLEMMDEAEYSFAMHNAHPALRERARYVAPPNSQNGVVRTISSVPGLPWTDWSG